MKNMDKVAAAMEPDKLMTLIQQGVAKAEKATGLAPVFLKRDSFAGTSCATGCLSIDRAIGGGIPCGRIIGIPGPESHGKSLLVTQVAIEQLRAKRVVILLDAEGGSDPIFLKARGIEFEKYRGERKKDGTLKPGQFDYIHFYQPETGDQFMHYLHGVMSNLPDNRNADAPPIIFILDSVVALISDAVSGDIDANRMAMHAKMYAEILPVINSQLVRTGCSFIYTNQIRQRPGVSFGSPEYEPCGDALKFFSSIRMRLSRSKPKIFRDAEHPFVAGFIPDAEPKADGVWQESNLDVPDGLDRYIYTAVTTIKNKVFNPKQVTWMRIQFERNGETGRGLDPVFDLFTIWAEGGVIEKRNPRIWRLTEEYFTLIKEHTKDIQHSLTANIVQDHLVRLKPGKKTDQEVTEGIVKAIKEGDKPTVMIEGPTPSGKKGTASYEIGDLEALEFNYVGWKRFAETNPWLIQLTRAKLIESGKIYAKSEGIQDESVSTEE